ncbi:N-formylglutamate amidohydrolase [Alteromonas sp. C1M14]|uniref:N-formylglutamate amidohydrolase n=1 Tax=Alteromonas sp. C1M14 TaxID=2841567 RepID=UPI001C09E6C1|nr:N-formylglutamate amidohydrolase [Alteromonas sp. C1M14]MBU2979540.1 N-formylglutamate amidohydrolase [Alteromonas sp. C1M14]
MLTEVSFASIRRSPLSKATLAALLMAGALVQTGCSTHHTSLQSDDTQSHSDVFDKSWLHVVKGNMPLVISAPHGGMIKPDNIADRECGTQERDDNTDHLALEIEKAFETYGQKPYLVIAKISRAKIDLNRDLETATCGNQKMAYTWHQYHQDIEAALDDAISQFGYAMYIDLHGQSHKVRRLELGYSLRSPALKANYEATVTPQTVEKTSVENILQHSNDLSLKTLLTGEYAFGTLMAEAGFPSVPSQQDPYPLADQRYFTGGYNTRRYTSSDYPNVFGMQIESNFFGVRNSQQNQTQFSEAFAKVINDYLQYINQHVDWKNTQ